MAVTAIKIIDGEKMPVPSYSREDSLTSSIKDLFVFKPTVGDLMIKNNLTGEINRYTFNEIVKDISLTVGTKIEPTDITIPQTDIYGKDYIIYMNDNGTLTVSYNCQRVGFVVRKIGGRTLMTTDQPEPNKNCMYTIYSLPKEDVPLDIGFVNSFRYTYNGFSFGSSFGSLNKERLVSLHFRSSISVELSAGSYTVYTAKWDYLRDNPKSDEILIEVTKTLEKPTLSVEYNELTSKAIISWNEIDGAKKYIVKRNGSIVTSTNLLNYETNIIGNYEVIATNDDNDYLLDSEPTNINIEKQWEIDTPNPLLVMDSIIWNNVDNAIGYKIYKDGRDITPNGIVMDTKFKIIGYGYYKIQAIPNPNSLYEDSELSNAIEYEKIEIIFYKNSSETNRLDKTEYLVKVFSLNGVLRGATSITNPVIQIEMFQVPDCNYCYIPVFNRYYYIDDIISVRTRLWELSMSVDPLMSYKDKVLKVSALVSRNEEDYNLFINDPLIPVTTEPNVVTSKLAENIFGNLTSTSRCFVMTFAGYNESNSKLGIGPFLGSAVNKTYFMNIGELKSVLSEVYNTDFWSNVGNLFGGDPTEGIINIREYPFDFDELLDKSDYTDVQEIEVPFGKNLSITNARKLKTNKNIFFVVDDLNTGNVDSMEDLPPFCNYQLYIPFYGFIDLPPSFIGVDFGISWHISLRDGVVFITLARGGQNIEMVLEATIGMEIPLTRSGAAQRISAYANTAMKLVGGAISGGAGLGAMYAGLSEKVSEGSASNYVASAQFGSALVSTGIDTFTAGLSGALKVKPNAPSTNIGQSYSGFFIDDYIILVKSKPETVTNRTNKNYRHLFGLPNNNFYKLKDVHGYTICNTFHLDGFDVAFESELQGISIALKSGIILP